MTGIHSKIAGLSTAKRLLLEKELRLLRERSEAAATTTIPRRTLLTPSPPSFSQVRLWFLEQLKPGGSVYNMPIAVRLEGVLDVEALASALNALVDRHEILRTRFGVEDGGPVQVIAPELKAPLLMEDLGSVPAQDREVELQREMQSAADIPFDLAQGPLFRANLLRLGEQTHVLVLTLHHIISDGWSRGVLMRELSTLYAAHCQGKPSPLPALPVQYADYAIWQRDRLQGEVLEKQVSYWREQLKDLEVLDLPTDRPRPAVQSSRGAQLHFDLPAALSEGLETLSQRAGVTLFMTLLAGFQVLLQRYSGQDDIVVGSPIAGRNRIEIEGLIGFFVNTLVLRTDLSGDPTFMELLGRVREVALGAYAHQELPFEKLVEELQPERDQSRNPLFQVGFVLQNTPHAELDLPGIKASPQTVQRVVAKFDLSLSILNKDRRLQGVVGYNADLFDAVTIDRLAEHYRILLGGALAEPDQPVTGLPLLIDAERRQLMEDWNATEATYPKDQCAQQLFEAQAARNPEAVAVVHQDQQLSYAELNARANQLAHYLRAQRVGPNVLVAICVERSLDMIIGVLGILKAGGAYVPLDPGYPRDRLAFMLEDTHAPVLVTQAALQGALPRGDFEVLCLDSDWERIERESDKNTENLAGPEHLAYVIYTSGSTGVPKGVEIQHRSLVNLVTWYHKHIITSPQDRATLIAGPAFDASVANIWPTITAGASLYIPDEETRLSPDLLLDWYVSKKITVSYAPTPLATLLIDCDQPVDLVLRILLTGGDKLKKGPKEALPYRFINLYGPTESTVETTWGDITTGQATPPIGRPISNTRLYILDARLKLVPIGVVGELYIGGDGLARGYLNRPELTAERFIPNPLPGAPGKRLYRTGDLVRYRADGNIEFVSRNDDQVKIRGFRIELGEIETTLNRHPQVRDSIVMVREDEVGGKRLVAYVVTGQVTEDFKAALRDCLKKTLPEYMVPTAFIILDAFPLTPNGKVDKQALSALDPARSRDTEYVAPGTPFEEELAVIWCELLRLDRVGIHDNFFQLGGHSLLVMQVISRIKFIFQIDLALQEFFEDPTVAGMSQIVINAKMEQAGDQDLESLLSELEEITDEEAFVKGVSGKIGNIADD